MDNDATVSQEMECAAECAWLLENGVVRDQGNGLGSILIHNGHITDLIGL